MKFPLCGASLSPELRNDQRWHNITRSIRPHHPGNPPVVRVTRQVIDRVKSGSDRSYLNELVQATAEGSDNQVRLQMLIRVFGFGVRRPNLRG